MEQIIALARNIWASIWSRFNKDKISIFFSKNTRAKVKDLIIQVAGVKSTQPNEKYLGLPTLVGRSRSKGFKNILDRVRDRISNWKMKYLSQAGKEILIKIVIQAIPTYNMRVFKISKNILMELNRLMQQYWWGQKIEEKRIRWCSWRKMRQAKASGGLGFRDLEQFNLAMLAKQEWRLIQNPSSLAAKVFSTYSDRISWRCTTNDIFSMRSAYHLQLEIQQRAQGQPSNPAGHKERWNRLWKLPVPNAEKLFLWKACNNELPTNANLLKEKLQKGSIRQQTFKELMIKMLDELDKEVLEEMAVVAWRIWKRRNEVVFQQEFISPNSLLKQATQKLKELRLLHHKSPGIPSTDSTTLVQWEASSNSYYKINWDSAVDKQQCKIGIGTIIRDWEGELIATMRMKRSLFPSPYLAEAYAAL
ncbi:hypothetical protein F2P56_006796 [Juglans regia]|uniref:Uncharacterized protein LOC108996747 n=2 Tax=Juglans regia TaxID=51240 RepID=A0A2I4F9I4_JUGRE|nr:uncharacterized protein LOC108996747 [Juglans regia]KAF5474944.1 hypothetical protein F2P56_006796 [Juglans regia]